MMKSTKMSPTTSTMKKNAIDINANLIEH
uniref:Uncharacterized protein n=1 Tax=Romanomermis culicivorax TaxID=13658 RepID=A0A915K5T0_ROMCU